MLDQSQAVILITGAAHRVGATMARMLHQSGFRIIIHYRASADAANALAQELNTIRLDSAATVAGDLLRTDSYKTIIADAVAGWGRLDGLINNASSFYPTEIGSIGEQEWDDLMGSNLKAPLFLSQAAWPHLQEKHGAIINIVDIHADRPLRGYPLYSMAKAGLVMLTKSLARELAPEVRVNGIAPGAILWPEQGLLEQEKQEILDRIALKRQGTPEDIAKAARYLLIEAEYTTGQIMAVDGGRSLFN